MDPDLPSPPIPAHPHNVEKLHYNPLTMVNDGNCLTVGIGGDALLGDSRRQASTGWPAAGPKNKPEHPGIQGAPFF
ncbi:MAG: hypothetical protein M3Y08_10155 [Fibrobacterota bacterium]|nr:hypothetical protein [Fibrobacterota bacterium]